MPAPISLPYLSTPGTLDKALPKIREAATPDRFTADFTHAVLQIKGGGGRALIPFLKKLGFLNGDGTPTSIYERFRNRSSAGKAMAEALRIGYKPLYQVNEYAHALSDQDLKGAIVQVTGLDQGNSIVQLIFSTFRKLKAHAVFDAEVESDPEAASPPSLPATREIAHHKTSEGGINLSYTINLNLPATTNVEVYHAIFRSLKEHLLP